MATGGRTHGHDVLLTGARRIGHAEPVDVLLRAGRIAAIGFDLSGTVTPTVEVVPLDGRTVMPGLWDAHVHLTQWALARGRLDLAGAGSAAEVVALVRERLENDPPTNGRPLVGFGFRDGLWPDEPTVAALDEVAGETPVVLVSGDLHCGWVSSAGLRHLGSPARPAGLLRETDWIPLLGVVDALPERDTDALVAEATRHAASLGVVGLTDFEVADNVAAWRRRAQDAPPAVRVRAAVWPQYLDRVVREDLHTGDPLADRAGLVQQGPLKVIVDGSLNTRTAWCHDPYPGLAGQDSRGVLAVPFEELAPLLAHARAHGLRAAVHAIGDAATGMVLDAFEASGAQGSVEHAQLVAWPDVPRFADLDLTASVQPEHAMDDRDVADHHWAGRTDRAFAYGALHRAGVRLALGSDAPVAPLDPWVAVDAAVFRSRGARDPWHPEQRLGVRTALAASVDGRTLDLQVGEPADLAVLDADPLATARSAGALRGTRAAATIVGGRWTHRDL